MWIDDFACWSFQIVNLCGWTGFNLVNRDRVADRKWQNAVLGGQEDGPTGINSNDVINFGNMLERRKQAVHENSGKGGATRGATTRCLMLLLNKYS